MRKIKYQVSKTPEGGSAYWTTDFPEEGKFHQWAHYAEHDVSFALIETAEGKILQVPSNMVQFVSAVSPEKQKRPHTSITEGNRLGRFNIDPKDLDRYDARYFVALFSRFFPTDVVNDGKGTLTYIGYGFDFERVASEKLGVLFHDIPQYQVIFYPDGDQLEVKFKRV